MAYTILLKSIGCRTNQEEMASLSAQLSADGHAITDTLDAADVVIVNTCLVTAATESKTRRMISAISRLNPLAKICITGCLAQHSPQDIKERMAVTWVVGNSQKHTIPEILKSEAGGIFHDDLLARSVRESQPLSISETVQPPQLSSRTRFSVKIQEGCDFRCAYCIVPLVRGPSVSADVIGIEETCRKAIAAGYKEIVFTGTHIDQYKTTDCTSLFTLANRIASLDGDFRLRLSSLDPRDCTEQFLTFIATHPKLCRHCHISMQSLSPDVLMSMNRPVAGLSAFVNMLVAFRKQFPAVGIGGDFIVGFPSETSRMFQETVDRIREIGFSYGHVFRYSKRPGTLAASMADTVDEKEKSRRGDIMRKTLDECNSAFIEANRTLPQTIIVENENPAGGLSSNYLRITVPHVSACKNTWLNVMINGVDTQSGHCIARPV